jgi:energy-coupling factor transporter ATP-binding protein EcfA2
VTAALVRVEGVSFAYPGAAGEVPRPVLRDVSLQIMPGELVALIGQNGSGKTTLARHLNGLLRPLAGRVLVGEDDTREVPVGRLARHVGYVFQNPDHQLFLPSVRREVTYGPQQLGLRGADLESRVAATLERFGLTQLAEHHPAMLGRGLRRLTALAAVHAMGPRLLVLDEPTGGLDVRQTARLMEMLHTLVADGQSVVLITHEMPLVAQHATRVIALHDGEVVADEAPAALFDRADVLARARLQAPEPALLAAELRAAGVPLPGGIATVDAFCSAWLRLWDGSS